MKPIALLMMLFAVTTASLGQNAEHYLSIEEALRDTTFIGNPPEFGSLLYEYDIHMYLYGKTLRSTERGKQAALDADASATNLCKVFSEAFGCELSAQKLPQIFKLINRMKEDAGSYSTRCSKSRSKRQRPYVMFGESTSVPNDEDLLRHNSSFVSGHAALAMAVSMALAYINPEKQNDLYARACAYSDARWITGFHYFSDVKAGQLVGALVLPALLNNQEFVQQLNRAKEEFKKLSEMQKVTSYHQPRRLPRGVD